MPATRKVQRAVKMRNRSEKPPTSPIDSTLFSTLSGTKKDDSPAENRPITIKPDLKSPNIQYSILIEELPEAADTESSVSGMSLFSTIALLSPIEEPT